MQRNVHTILNADDTSIGMREAIDAAISLLLETGATAIGHIYRTDLPGLVELMDDHAPTYADDIVDVINVEDPSALCDRFGDWCDFPA